MKKIIIVLCVIGVVSSGVYFYSKYPNQVNFTSVKQAVENKPTRTEQVESLISKLQADREQDPTFIAETTKMQDELEKQIAGMRQALVANRKAQSRLDALMVIQTQYDMEISDLEKTQLVVKK